MTYCCIAVHHSALLSMPLLAGVNSIDATSDVLLYVAAPVISQQQCQDLAGDVTLSQEQHLCTDDGSSDTAQQRGSCVVS